MTLGIYTITQAVIFISVNIREIDKHLQTIIRKRNIFTVYILSNDEPAGIHIFKGFKLSWHKTLRWY
jgi:hypothetical protein